MEKLNEFIQGESFPVGILPEAESFQFNEVREELVVSSSSMDVRSLSQFKSSDLLLKSLKIFANLILTIRQNMTLQCLVTG